MTANAAQACADLGLAHLVLNRPPWDAADATVVATSEDAAAVVAERGYSRVFLTTGRSGVGAFRSARPWFLIRVVTAPDPADLPADHELLLSRGPYRYDAESRLLAGRAIDVLVTKNSGGALTRAKVDAADALGVDVVMIDRPPLPDGITAVGSVGDAQRWLLGPDTAQPG